MLYARLGWNGTSTTTPPPATFGQGSSGYSLNLDHGFQQQPAGNLPTTEAPIWRNATCDGVNAFMGTIVSDAAPYLFPVVIEYSLIAAAVAFIIWRNIGRGVPTKS